MGLNNIFLFLSLVSLRLILLRLGKCLRLSSLNARKQLLVLERRLAIKAQVVSCLSHTAQMHQFRAGLALNKSIVRVKLLLTIASFSRLWETSLSALIISLSEKEGVEVI